MKSTYKIHIFLFILFLGGLPSIAQVKQLKEEIDSIMNILPGMNDYEKMNSYYELTSKYEPLPNGMDSIAHYSKLALIIAEKTKNDTFRTRTNYRLGHAAWFGKQDFPLSLEYFKKSKSIILESGVDLNRLTHVNNSIGCIYMITGEMEEALVTFQNVYDASLESQDHELMAMASTNMSRIHLSLGDTINCMNLNEKSLNKLNGLQDDSLDETRAAIIINLGDLYRKTKQYDKALDLITQGRVLIDKRDNFRQDGRITILEARILDELGEKDKLYRLVNEKLPKLTGLVGHDKEIYTSLLNYKGAEHLSKKEFSKTSEIIRKLEQYLTDSNVKHQRNLLNSLQELTSGVGDFESAYTYIKRHHLLKDSLNEKDLQSKLIEADKKYELENKELLLLKETNKNLELKSFNSKLLLSGLGLLVLGLGFYLRSYRKGQQEKERIDQMEQKILALQMNPHFIFNALSSIQNYLFDEGDTKLAVIHLSTFSTLLRQMLENSRERFIPLTDEIDFLKNYLNLQKLRFDNKFDYEISIQPDIDMHTTAIPPLITQPFIENAIEHGKIYNVKDGLLKIDITKASNRIAIKILDNGKGFSENKTQTNPSGIKKNSLSIKITNERLSLLSKLMNKKWNLSIQSKEQSGTEVHFNIPEVSMSNL